MNDMIRISKHSIPEVQETYEETIEDPGMHYGTYRGEIDGDQIKMSSHRLWTFFEKSLECVECGLKGEFFAKEKNHESEGRPHLNLYAVKDGEEILMTKDHIHPKSKGGDNHLDNYQTMCLPCNEEKGAEIQ